MKETNEHRSELREQFETAVSEKDLDKVQTILLSKEGSSDGFHKIIWESADAEGALEKEEIDEAFRKFRVRISPKKRTGRAGQWAAAFSAAACLLLALLLWQGRSADSWNRKMESVGWMELTASASEMKEIMLPDGTHIWLNSGSSLIYPDNFYGRNRKVFISGEGYFEVAKDTEHPFIVQSGDASVTVTGTKFDIRAYDDDFSTTLVEGGVNVEIGEDRYILVPGERLSGNMRDRKMMVSRITENKYPTWFRGDLKAFDEPLSSIAEELERRFGVEIVIRDKELAESRFSFSFVNKEGLEDILKSLNMDNELRISRKDDIIDISKNS